MMNFAKYTMIFFLWICFPYYGSGQNQGKSEQNNTEIQQKTPKIYENIQKISAKNKWTDKLHRLIFHSVNTEKEHSPTTQVEKKFQRSFKQYQGKKIRKIRIETLDPLGFSEKDSTATPNKWEALGNLLHNKTKSNIVKRLLLVRENQPLDSLLVRESERILRSQRHIRSAMIFPKTDENSDFVDLDIFVLDAWTMLFDAFGSLNHFSVRGQEYNLFGLGNYLSVRYNQQIRNSRQNGFSVRYQYPNIYNTNVNFFSEYALDYERYHYKRVQLYRPYFSLYTRWVAGAEFSEQTYKDFVSYNDLNYSGDVKTIYQNFWAGVFFPIFKNEKTKGQVTNLNFSMRYYQRKFPNSPEIKIQNEDYYEPRKLYLSSVGIYNLGYEQDRYIFRHKDIEDVPVGKNLSFLMGFSDNPSLFRSYFGVQARYASYKKWGYISTGLEMGSFFETQGRGKQTTLKFEFTYFSKLLNVSHWNYRQFVKLRSVVGVNRNLIEDRISLNEEDKGIIGFHSQHLEGTRRNVLSLQTQFYSPISWLGFRVSPFLVADVGAIGNTEQYLWKDTFFTKFGVGFYITNDYLLFDSVQFSFFYFPNIPGVGQHIYKLTSSRNDDFQLPNLGYQAPRLIEYR